jgi:ring-1,2-phenylacetyl-CoA epoxidase subunit PaaC
MTKNEALQNYCLRLGDTCLILGQRMAEWCSKGPFLEEDIAMSNIGLDFFGQAKTMLTYASQIQNKNKTADDLAFKRSEREFFNSLLSERPNTNFAYTVIRNFFHDVFFLNLYQRLAEESSDELIAAFAAKSVKEVKYHLRHNGEWIIRLGDGTPESHTKVQTAINDLWPYTGDLFEMNAVDEILIKENITIDLKSIKEQWIKTIKNVFNQATVSMPADGHMHSGRLEGIHSEILGYILAEMQHIPRSYPDAKW